MSEFESLVRAYGNSIGYYFQRKASGADRGERLTLLNQIIATYGNSQLDLSLVRSELESLNKTQLPVETPAVKPIAPAAVIAPEPATSVPAVQPTPVLMPKSPAKTPTATPAQKPTPQPVKKPEMKPVVKPTPRSEPRSAEVWTDPEMQRAWDFYRDATARDISDHERIELLEGMLRRFGERGADRINKELQRIQRRVNTDGE